jgi:hypothetical protein
MTNEVIFFSCLVANIAEDTEDTAELLPSCLLGASSRLTLIPAYQASHATLSMNTTAALNLSKMHKLQANKNKQQF